MLAPLALAALTRSLSAPWSPSSQSKVDVPVGVTNAREANSIDSDQMTIQHTLTIEQNVELVKRNFGWRKVMRRPRGVVRRNQRSTLLVAVIVIAIVAASALAWFSVGVCSFLCSPAAKEFEQQRLISVQTIGQQRV